MSPLEQTILSRLKQMVTERAPLHQMIVFGSRARNQAEPDSDMNVLVVLQDPVDEAMEDVVSACAWEAGFEHGIVVAPVTISRQAWEEGPERNSLLAIAIHNEGIAV